MTENIRNFVIIAHIDHGKSTLADRMLEITHTVAGRLMKEQYLDSLDLERERGITIKMAPVRMIYRLSTNNKQPITGNEDGGRLPVMSDESSSSEFILNLIDTPGHSDFSYEVSRALAAVEGAVLLVDATQGIQAQTLANFESARASGLTIIGAVNKIDVASEEQIKETVQNISDLLKVKPEEILQVSGKTGAGAEKLLREIIKRIPAPKNNKAETSRALIFDSLYDEHKGVIVFLRVIDGEIKTNDTLYFLATNTGVKAKEVGYFAPELKRGDKIRTGETGYVATGIKNPDKIHIGDTVAADPKAARLPGYKRVQPVVFVSFYPEDANDYDNLYRALQKLRLTDASLTTEPDMSEALGRGFKGGFLGRLHFEIIAERLAQEFNIVTVHSFPSVAYKVKLRNGKWLAVNNPKDLPDDYLEIQEPIAKVEIVTPLEYLSAVLGLKEFFRFHSIETKTMGNKSIIGMRLPLADLISDFDDKLKSASRGYASLNYEIAGYETAKLEKLEVLINSRVTPGLTRIIPVGDAEREGRATVEKLKKLLPRQQFKQALQAAIRGRIVAREDIPAAKKNVTGHLYGGDRTRKMKLWKKQQKGKKRLEERSAKAAVRIPASVFKELLKR